MCNSNTDFKEVCYSSVCSNLSVYSSYPRSGTGLFLAYPALFSVCVSLSLPHFLAESAHTAWVFSLAGFGKGVCSHRWGKASSKLGFRLRAGTGLASIVTFLIQKHEAFPSQECVLLTSSCLMSSEQDSMWYTSFFILFAKLYKCVTAS